MEEIPEGGEERGAEMGERPEERFRHEAQDDLWKRYRRGWGGDRWKRYRRGVRTVEGIPEGGDEVICGRDTGGEVRR